RTLQDLQMEKSERHNLEMQLRHPKLRTTLGRKYVVVLIDADGYKFREDFLGYGKKGGRAAATEILAQTRRYIKRFKWDIPDPDGIDIIIRAFANLDGLGPACWREMRTGTPDLRPFASEFSAHHPLVDFIDVGFGSQRADQKIKGKLEV
ncbi:MAG: hypothetical protein Q9198_007603, partial [Flavoplaca austrocitrina]